MRSFTPDVFSSYYRSMSSHFSDPGQLTELREQHPGLLLVDTRLAEDYAIEHIPGARNQCVFEVAFLGELSGVIADKNQALCVYGASESSHESRMAAEKLERAGFTAVHEFRGGLEAWKAAGNAVAGTAAPLPAPVMHDGRYALDVRESTVVWVGRNLINRHWGHVALASGHVEFRDGKILGGEAVLDMRRITCSDLMGNALHEVLIRHLESDDFFDVERYPEARFQFAEGVICSESAGCRNLRLAGSLTLRGITKPLSIESSAGFTPDGKAALQASLLIDRTEWNVLYGSGKFFHRLAGHLVNDHIELQLRILTEGAVCF